MILKNIIALFWKTIKLPFRLIKNLFNKFNNPKKTKFSSYMEDLTNLKSLNLPINSIIIHFNEENGLTYDITSKEEKKSVKGLKNKSIKKDTTKIQGTEEETSEKKATNTTKKKVGRRKKSSSED